MNWHNKFLLREIGGQPVLVPLGSQVIDTNCLLVLNETGRYVWSLLDKDRSMDDLATALSSRFSVEFTRARIDLQTFLNKMSSFGNSNEEPGEDFGSLIRDLHERAAACRQPVNGIFELTDRCNLSCPMCYIRRPANDGGASRSLLSAAEWVKLAGEARDAGMVFLLLTGGEVFTRDDFFDIYEPLTRLGFMLTLYTNGTLITETIAKRLAQAPPSTIEITLYGATATTYESISGVPGSFSRCCDGIEMLLRHRIPLGLKTTITQKNAGEIDQMRVMATNWGLTFSADWLLNKRRDGTISDVEDCRLSAAECIALEISNGASDVSLIEATLRKPLVNSDANFFCHAGKAAFVVSPAGEMNVCLDLPLPAARPFHCGFGEAWKAVQQFVDSSPPVASSDCLACDVRIYCHRCPAWSSLETGTLTEPVPYLCAIANARNAYYQQGTE